jgi:hypothetical protein
MTKQTTQEWLNQVHNLGLERLFRDVRAAKYHPLPESDQQRFLGEYILGNGRSPSEPAQMVQALRERVTG